MIRVSYPASRSKFSYRLMLFWLKFNSMASLTWESVLLVGLLMELVEIGFAGTLSEILCGLGGAVCAITLLIFGWAIMRGLP